MKGGYLFTLSTYRVLHKSLRVLCGYIIFFFFFWLSGLPRILKIDPFAFAVSENPGPGYNFLHTAMRLK